MLLLILKLFTDVSEINKKIGKESKKTKTEKEK